MPPTLEDRDRILELLRRWREGDRKALDELLTKLMPWLRGEISRALADRPRPVQDSLDLAQSAVVEFLSWGPKFVPETDAQLRALLKRIAINGLIDEERRRARRGHGAHFESIGCSSALSGFAVAAPSADGPSREAQRGEDTGWVRLALQFLEPDERYLLIASEVEGFDWAMIAEELELESADAARMRCARLKPHVGWLLVQLRKGRLPEQ
jgi:RNA polymerase sigma factor (sigma-70 family)